MGRQLNPYSASQYTLRWFKLLTFRERWSYDGKEVISSYVLYGEGRHYLHIMDWRGCNFHHGRLPDSPVFKTKEDAFAWLKERVEGGQIYKGMTLHGHHAGEYECRKGCDDRTEGYINFTLTGKSIEWKP